MLRRTGGALTVLQATLEPWREAQPCPPLHSPGFLVTWGCHPRLLHGPQCPHLKEEETGESQGLWGSGLGSGCG